MDPNCFGLKIKMQVTVKGEAKFQTNEKLVIAVLTVSGLDWAPAQHSLFHITVVLTMWKAKKGVRRDRRDRLPGKEVIIVQYCALNCIVCFRPMLVRSTQKPPDNTIM